MKKASVKRIVLVLYSLVFLWAAYRSVTQAITVNEAVTYNHFASHPNLQIVTSPYNPSNQILHSLLCRLVLRVFRVTEWSLRIPSLLGLLFYLWAGFRLCTRASNSNLACGVAAIAIAVNPFTVGWLPESTGIWMAAGWFFWALNRLLDYSGREGDLWPASLALGIAVGFQFSFHFPALVLIFVILHFEFWGARRISGWQAINQLILPGSLLAFSLWIIPFLNARTTKISPADLLQMDWVVLLPGLAVLSIPGLVTTNVWRVSATCLLLLLTPIVTLPSLKLAYVPDRFHAGPESALPKVARALREELRRAAANPNQCQ